MFQATFRKFVKILVVKNCQIVHGKIGNTLTWVQNYSNQLLQKIVK